VGADFSFHDARRTLITIAVEYLDIDRPSVKALVNHSSVDVTDGYSIRQIETARRRMVAIERFILTAAGRLPSADVRGLHPADDQGQANPAAA
jgi:integrase